MCRNGKKPPSNCKILHIVYDAIFIDDACDLFETVFPGGNEYLYIGSLDKFKFIQTSIVKQIPHKIIFTNAFRSSLRKYKGIIFHSFCGFSDYYIALSASAHTKVLWVGWGFDYYDLVCKKEDLLKPETLSLFNKQKRGVNLIYPLKKTNSFLRSFTKSLVKRRSMRRIDYFSPVIYEDYQMVKRKIPDMRAEYLPWNYINLKASQEFENVSGDNILIGNSASYENNHLDLFHLLLDFDLTGRNIICPLSYGDEQYRDHIISKGKEYFGDAFKPLIEFLDLSEYKRKISSCSIVLMNHLRQQAVGNINIALVSGAKVFLDSANPLFEHYRNLGVKVFSMNELHQHSFSRLSEEDAQKNRYLIQKGRRKDIILSKTQDIVIKLTTN